MTLLRSGADAIRRHLAKIAVVGMLAPVLLATVAMPSAGSVENRRMADAPAMPASWSGALALPAAADAWVGDHFGWRTRMVELYTRLRYHVFGRFATDQVTAGRNGRIFLATHNPATPDSAILAACGWQYRDVPFLVQDLNTFARIFRDKGIDAKMLIVPSSPIVHSEDLPAWQAGLCPPEVAPARALLASPALTPEAKRLAYFPLDEMRAMRASADPFPSNFFHWAGAGPREVAALAEERFWQRPRSFGSELPTLTRPRPSDIGHLFPGIPLEQMVGEPDFAKTAIRQCWGAHCFPGMETGMAKLLSVSRFNNDAPGLAPRLVIVADSFGEPAGQWYSKYYSEVVVVCTNFVGQMTKAEREQLRQLVFRPGGKDEVLYLYHDATVYARRISMDLALLRP